MTYMEKIKDQLSKGNGIITAFYLREHGIPTVYLTRLTRQGVLKRIAPGIYMTEDAIYDELFVLQTRYPKIIYSYETALFILNLTDKLPESIHVTVNYNYKFNTRPKNTTIYHVSEGILNLGVIEVETNIGNPVRTYSAERVLCDFIKNKNDMDSESYLNFVKAYPKYEKRNIHVLLDIAQRMNVTEEVQEVMELVYE